MLDDLAETGSVFRHCLGATLTEANSMTLTGAIVDTRIGTHNPATIAAPTNQYEGFLMVADQLLVRFDNAFHA